MQARSSFSTVNLAVYLFYLGNRHIINFRSIEKTD